ncbi:hypothetical protein D3C84_1050220 [compost metagenome]
MGRWQGTGKQHLHRHSAGAERIARAQQHVLQCLLHRGAQAGRDTHVDDLREQIALLLSGLGADQRIAAITKLCRMASVSCGPRELGLIEATIDL